MSVRTSVSSQRAPMVKVCQVVSKEELKGCTIIILIGPTGGGKSNFIEKLASQAPGETNITGIADHKLTPGPAQIVAYRMDHQFLDLWTDKPIIFVDTPGLCDKDKSDAQTKSEIEKWKKTNAVQTVDRLLYVDRISDNRAPRSKSKTIKVLESLGGKDAARRTVVMTTMWDLMWNDRLKAHADHRYNLLKNENWKDFLGQGFVRCSRNIAAAIFYTGFHTSDHRSGSWEPIGYDDPPISCSFAYTRKSKDC
ncbi:hypothetical protein BJ165DRAFT_860798 [Panaeolus papilionaceus]|nr:hypothetical protein BJ165DRAFT_860798 [Panaeolus papilionaceus]